MVSITASERKPKQSRAAELLTFVTGERRVDLSKLTRSELTALLAKKIDEIDLREIRGFRELKDLLSWRDEGKNVGVSANATVVPAANGFPQLPFHLKSHVIDIRNPLTTSGHDTWKDNETGQEETDPWTGFPVRSRQGKYLYGFERTILVLRRLPENLVWDSGNQALVEVTVRYTKVTGKDEYIADSISPTRIPVTNFCRHFGDSAGTVAHTIFFEIAGAYESTVRDLESLTHRSRTRATEWRHFAEATN